MNLSLQKKLARNLKGVGKRRVHIDLEKLDEIGGSVEDFRQSITKNDIRGYINSEVITVTPARGASRGRARKIHEQKRKGRRKGVGSRKGHANARLPEKSVWIARIRLQRKTLMGLRSQGKISKGAFRELYLKAKGGFFRSKRHIMLYVEERGLVQHGKS